MGELIGVCRVALPIQHVQKIISRIRNVLLLASDTALVLTVFLSFITAGTITRPIRRLTQTTKTIADGQITSRVLTHSIDELGRLSRHFN